MRSEETLCYSIGLNLLNASSVAEGEYFLFSLGLCKVGRGVRALTVPTPFVFFLSRRNEAVHNFRATLRFPYRGPYLLTHLTSLCLYLRE